MVAAGEAVDAEEQRRVLPRAHRIRLRMARLPAPVQRLLQQVRRAADVGDAEAQADAAEEAARRPLTLPSQLPRARWPRSW